MKELTKRALVLFLSPALALARLDPSTCATTPHGAASELALHKAAAPLRQRLRQARLRLATPDTRPAVRDLGDIALIDDSEGVVAQRNPFRLDRLSLRFSPSTSAAGVRYAYTVENTQFNADIAAQGSALEGIGDDDSRPVTLPFAFPFYGRSHSRVFINSDGNLTFDQPDNETTERSLGRFTAGAPRIAPFFADLDPSVGGEIRVTSQPDRATITWVNVPDFDSRGASPNSFQVTLYPDGRIDFSYNGVISRSAVVGIAPGALRNGTSIVTFNAGSSGSGFSGAVAERFSGTIDVDTVFVAQKFFENHDDAYDYLVIYNNLDIPAAPGAVAFENTVRSNRLGIGDPPTDIGAEFGSPRRLQAVLNMGPLTQYPRDPNAVVPSRSTSRDTPLSVLAHETGHLWLAFASVRDESGGQPMLGRQSAHWAFTFNSEASILEGNRIEDSGPNAFPRFRTVATVEAYAPLDQYLMGLRPASEVPPTFYVGLPSIGTFNRAPQSGVTFHGERRNVTVEDVIAAVGPRVPDHTVSQRRFRFAFILITAQGVEPAAEQISQLDGYRRAFEGYFERVAGGRAFADTQLRRELTLSLAPAAGVVNGGPAVNASLTLARPAEADLTVVLTAANGLAELPRSVTIPAGRQQASFPIRGVRTGVEEIAAEPADSRYATAFARVQVLDSARSLRLQLISGDKQFVTASGPLPQPVVIQVSDANQLPYAGVAVTATVTDGGSVTPAQATSDESGLIRFTWTPGPNPLHQLNVTLGGSPGTAGVTATAIGKPAIGNGAVVNSASLAPGIAPGSLATIFGASLAGGLTAQGNGFPPLQRLAGVTVTLNGRPTGLLYVSDGQINFVVPDNAAPGQATLTVAWGSESVATQVEVRSIQPGIFMDSNSGLGAITVANSADLTNTRPAAPGDVISVYATGLGAVRPNIALGLQETAGRTTVTIGGVGAEVLFSGLAPGFIGLYQVNARIPASGVAAGLQPVVLSVDGIPSNTANIRVR